MSVSYKYINTRGADSKARSLWGFEPGAASNRFPAKLNSFNGICRRPEALANPAKIYVHSWKEVIPGTRSAACLLIYTTTWLHVRRHARNVTVTRRGIARAREIYCAGGTIRNRSIVT